LAAAFPAAGFFAADLAAGFFAADLAAGFFAAAFFGAAFRAAGLPLFVDLPVAAARAAINSMACSADTVSGWNTNPMDTIDLTKVGIG